MSRKFYFIFLISLLLLSRSYAQDYCGMTRFDTFIFDISQTEVISDIKYGEGPDETGDTDNLHLDIYRPAPVFDALEKKPLVFFVHGGGLVGGDKLSEGAVDLGNLYARSGFVYASIDYRIGWNNGDDETGCGGDTTDLDRATYRAVQDTKAAFRYLKANADLYGIDTNYIFVEGNSAGSTVLLYCLYAGQNDFKSIFYDELGSIDSADNDDFNHAFDPLAFIGEASGFSPIGLLENKYVPTLYFHGTCDSIVPYFNGPLFFCYQPFSYPRYHGSWDMVQVFKENDLPYWFYTGEGASHDVVIPDSLIKYSQPFIKSILCNTLTTHEYYRVLGKKRCATEEDGELFITQLYPNPIVDDIYITLTSTRDRDVDLYLYNAEGQTVGSVTLDFFPPVQSYVIDASYLPHGIYTMRVSQRQEVYVAKFVK